MKTNTWILVLLFVHQLSSSMGQDNHQELKNNRQKQENAVTVLDTLLPEVLVKLVREYCFLRYLKTVRHVHPTQSLQLCANGQDLVTRHHGEYTAIHNLVTETLHTIKHPRKRRQALKHMSPDSSTLLIGSEYSGQDLLTQDIATKRIRAFNPTYTLYDDQWFSTTGQYLCSYWQDRKNEDIRGYSIFEASSGKLLSSQTTPYIWKKCIAFNADDTRIALEEEDASISVLSIDLNKVYQRLRSDKYPSTIKLQSLAFSHDSKKLLTSTPLQVDLWDIASAQCTNLYTYSSVLPLNYYCPIGGASFVNNDTLVAISEELKAVKFIDLVSKKIVATRSIPQHDLMAVSRDGCTMAVGRQGGLKTYIFVDPFKYLAWEAREEKNAALKKAQENIESQDCGEFSWRNFCVLQ